MHASRFVEHQPDMEAYQYIQIRITGHKTRTGLKTDMTRFYSYQKAVVEICSSVDDKVQASIALNKIDHETTSIFASIDGNCPVVFYFEKDSKKIRLPESMTKNLVGFLKQYKPYNNKKYCCINFTYEMLYGRDAILHNNNPNNFEKKTFQEEKLIPGSTVYLYKQNLLNGSVKYQHYAVYIGCRSYLSLFGNTGHLTIATLDEMKNAWGSETCLEVSKLTTKDKPHQTLNQATKPAGIITAIMGLFCKPDKKNDEPNRTRALTPSYSGYAE